jgi:cholesterol transport system auxiliary component
MRAALLVVGTLLLAGCALLGKSEPLVPRYFTPDWGAEATAPRARSGLLLRLGRVEGRSHLRERMAVRSSPRELYFHEDRRWTERPEVYLRHALSRALFEERGVVEALSGRALVLEVELVAFEEIERPHLARLQARMVLRDDRVVLLDETLAVEQAVAGGAGADPAAAVVEALSQVLGAGAAQIADRVVPRLAELAAEAAR